MNSSKFIMFETTKGNIKIKLYDEMPITTSNFKKLVLEKFYDGTIFHRVIDGFMIQGGCPQGTGMGGPGYSINDEFVKGISNVRGTISMANAGPNTGGSQFFINVVDNTYLDWDKPPFQSKHPVFGEIVEGMEVVDIISKCKTDKFDKPIKDIKITRAYLVDD